MMAIDTSIAERPVPPKGRLSFPMLILRMIANPVASWGEDFYEKPAVLYRWLRLLAAPLFRAEEMLRYVPAFAAASAPLLKRWNDSGADAAQRIDRDWRE